MNLIQKVKLELEKDSSGHRSQNLMSPVEDNTEYRTITDDHRVACVMALLHPKEDGQLYITYIIRAASHPDDKHAGQIGFPGGKLEEDDDSLLICALREVEEELGIPMDDIEVLGQMTSLFVSPSNFLVYPYVGYLAKAPIYTPQEAEVAGILEVPINYVFSSDAKMNKTLTIGSGKLREVPGYDIGGNFLWGATAMMTSELEDIYLRVSS